MKKFIFITKEGQTTAPNMDFQVENMQVIGIVENAADEDDALKILINENGWIIDAEFNIGEFIAYEIK